MNKKKKKTIKNRIISVFSEYFDQLSKAFIVLIIGLLTFLFTPLKENIYRIFYQEQADIILTSDNTRVHQGDTIKVNVQILPKSRIGVTGGHCEIIFDNNYFEGFGENVQFNFSETKEPKFLKNGHLMKLLCLKSGDAKIKSKIITAEKSYIDSIQIEILPPYKGIKPTINDFSGTWNFSLGSKLGKMNLIENKGKLSGIYELEGVDFGSIRGFRDGSTFNIMLIREGEMVKWNVIAIWKPKRNYIDINGKGYLYTINNNDWEKADKNEVEFKSQENIE